MERYESEDGLIRVMWSPFFAETPHLGIVLSTPSGKQKLLKYKSPTDWHNLFGEYGDGSLRVFVYEAEAELHIQPDKNH